MFTLSVLSSFQKGARLVEATCERLHLTTLAILSVKLSREVSSLQKQNNLKVLPCNTNLARGEQFLAEGFIVVGSRNLSALVINIRVHPINTVVGLLLGEGLEREGIQQLVYKRVGKLQLQLQPRPLAYCHNKSTATDCDMSQRSK